MGWASWISSFFRRAAPAAETPAPPPLLPSSEAAWWRLAADEARARLRGPRVQVVTRWDPAARDQALREAEMGQLRRIAELLDAMRSDGVISGIMSTRTGGMIRLPVKYSGDPFLVERLRGRDPVYARGTSLVLDPGVEGAFWGMCPDAEQIEMLWTGIFAGVSIGELVPRPDGPPLLRALDLHWLSYRHETESFHYQTVNGSFVVRPGDGRWVLFTPYGRNRPWIKGAWWPCALPFIAKQNAAFDRLRWQGQLADPLKLITASEGADEKHRAGLLEFAQKLWRRAAALVTPPKYTATLVESNGRGYEVYSDAEKRADLDIQVALAGQVVTTTGTTGFSTGSIWADIKADLVQTVAETWATTIHEQIFGPWAKRFHGVEQHAPWVRWDIRSPEQRMAEAKALGELAAAVDAADSMLARRGKTVDVDALLEEQGLSLPMKDLADPAPPARAAAPVIRLRVPERKAA